jgi:peptidoglycan hydrolase-like amidase
LLLRRFALFALLLATGPRVLARDVQFGVLSIFHPRQLILSATPGVLVVQAESETFTIESGGGTGAVHLGVSNSGVLLETSGHAIRVSQVTVTGRQADAVEFVLAVPGKISRTYRGKLEVKVVNGELVPIVGMDLEAAVASAVQAESAPNTPFEALKAQAIVTRSYYAAGRRRHRDFDFCDLTHCQFLRELPSPRSPAARAAEATRGMVIVFQDAPVAAMFTRSCGGQTRTPAELGMTGDSYPYFAVMCDYCHTHPVQWQRRISRKDGAALVAEGEAGRIAIDRRLGWDAIPSNNFVAHDDGDEVVIDGAGQGHGIGLCQRGARAMAESGAGFREILSHYFPNTTLNTPVRPHSF